MQVQTNTTILGGFPVIVYGHYTRGNPSRDPDASMEYQGFTLRNGKPAAFLAKRMTRKDEQKLVDALLEAIN